MFSLRVVFAFLIFFSSIPVSQSCIRTYNEDKETEATTPYVKPTTPFVTTPPEPDICSQCEKPMLSAPDNECNFFPSYPIPTGKAMLYEENGKCFLELPCQYDEVHYSNEPDRCESGVAEMYNIVCVNGKFWFRGRELIYISCLNPII